LQLYPYSARLFHSKQKHTTQKKNTPNVNQCTCKLGIILSQICSWRIYKTIRKNRGNSPDKS